ncbi:MAG: dUTP diphosphatase [Alphaproteobacteria bacterium]|nr:dUTP diphosphatase [Alphaproteobacteria bacterium]MDE2112307.1 dUTP diphosphatase [Alphaproteobacteria bacterium]MDE2494295.1 dUTP diphosphatase [Alphaproteobacteria bacterium]
MTKLVIKRLPHANDLPLPSYATEGSAGLDLLAAVDADVQLQPGGRVCVPCGIAMALPAGFEAQVRPRSGLALHHGITLLNAPGTIDSDYRGEVKATLINHGDAVFRITRGMKIAQLIVARYETVELYEVGELPESERGTNGFGSTGLHAATQRTA